MTKTYEKQNMSDYQAPIDLERFYMISGFEGEQKNKSQILSKYVICLVIPISILNLKF